MITKKMNIEEVKEFIRAQSDTTKIYLGTDSSCYKFDGDMWAEYSTVVVVHIDGNHGCKIFGQIDRERVYDQKKNKPAMRMMAEVYRTSEMFQEIKDVLGDREFEIHLDINPNKIHGSSVVVEQAIGYIKGTCNVVPFVKPNAWCASFGADRYSEIDSLRKKAEG